MVGLLGKHIARTIIESNGVDIGATRVFDSRFGGKKAGTEMLHFFDHENVSATKPAQQALLSAVAVAYDGKPKATLPTFSRTALITNAFGVAIDTGSFRALGIANDSRRFIYATDAVLVPATRKVRFDSYDYLVKDIVFVAPVNSASKSNANNTLRGSQKFNLAQYPNLESFTINESWNNELHFVFANSKLELFELSELPNLSVLSGKLPPSVKHIALCSIGSVSNVNDFVSLAVNAESVLFGQPLSSQLAITGDFLTSSLSGVLSLSHMSALKTLIIGLNAAMTDLQLPAGNTNWVYVSIQQLSATARGNFNSARVEDFLDSPNISVINFHTNGYLWNRTFSDADFMNSMTAFVIYGNSISGNITLAAAKPNLKIFRTGNNSIRAGNQQNSHPIVDITGLTQAVYIDLSGSSIEDLELPDNTVCTDLILFDNKLDIVTNPNLASQINAMTALVTLLLSQNSSSSVSVPGQDSTNGLGDVDLSSLSNLVTLTIASCKLTSLTLYNGNKLTTIVASFNPDLTSITNLLSHTGLLTLTLFNCDSFNQSITNVFTALQSVRINGTLIESIDLSGKVTTTNRLTVILRNNTSLSSLTMPSTEATARLTRVSGDVFQVTGNTSLNNIINLSNINWSATGASDNVVELNNNALDTIIPLGANNFIPSGIQLQNNGMSQANVDGTIDSLYTNRAKWNVYSIAKSLNIAGTNAAPSGTYQAPAGFVLGSNDGAPASAKEQLYVLVNNYGWVMTFN